MVLLVVGPDKLPEIAAQVGGWVRTVRDFLNGMKEQVSSEFGDVDPREYDPRKIVRDALAEPPRPSSPARPPGSPAPFDDEAT